MRVSKRFTVACVQITSGQDPAANLAATSALVREARAAGAELIATPEVSNMMGLGRREMAALVRPESEDPSAAGYCALAAETGAWLLVGSLVLRGAEDKLVNRSLLIDPEGAIAARYDKIHMFDVEIPDGQSYRESRAYQAGARAVTADLPWGRLGMTVCYDMRFPYLYRALAKTGADFLSVPSAFTRFTGESHWHVLLRARAIETGCFVIAPAQCGDHEGGRETYGHSLIVAPWGDVLGDGGTVPGITLAEIDPAEVARARAMIPALDHDRTFAVPVDAEPLREAGE
jgi:predicted amidohydrolase